jgi:hypothetical protein
MTKLIEFSMEAAGRFEGSRRGYPGSTPLYVVRKQPLYAEDFLSVYHDRELFGDA